MSDNDFEAQLERCEADAQALTEENATLRAERDEAIEALRGLRNALSDLMLESRGVDGLHRNGDIATWDELLPGGRFEWLGAVEPADAILAKHPPKVPT